MNVLVQNGVVAVADRVKGEIDFFYAQIIEIDRAIRASLRQL